MDRERDRALLELRDAVDSYLACNAAQGAADLVDAALVNIVDRIRACQRAGFDSEQIGSIITPALV